MPNSAAQLPDDPDLQHLIRLLAPLPGCDNIAFWNNVDTNGTRVDEISNETDPKPTGDGYLITKMQAGIDHLLKGDGSYLAQYLLQFFDGHRPQLWEYLNQYVPAGSYTNTAGERWTRELCDTAWRIVINSDQPDAAALATAWPGHRH